MLQKGKYQASEYPASKKRGMDVQATAITIYGMDCVFFKPTISFSGKPAFMKDFEEHLQRINQEPGNNIVGVYTLPSSVPYDHVAISVIVA